MPNRKVHRFYYIRIKPASVKVPFLCRERSYVCSITLESLQLIAQNQSFKYLRTMSSSNCHYNCELLSLNDITPELF